LVHFEGLARTRERKDENRKGKNDVLQFNKFFFHRS